MGLMKYAIIFVTGFALGFVFGADYMAAYWEDHQ